MGVFLRIIDLLLNIVSISFLNLVCKFTRLYNSGFWCKKISLECVFGHDGWEYFEFFRWNEVVADFDFRTQREAFVEVEQNLRFGK